MFGAPPSSQPFGATRKSVAQVKQIPKAVEPMPTPTPKVVEEKKTEESAPQQVDDVEELTPQQLAKLSMPEQLQY